MSSSSSHFPTQASEVLRKRAPALWRGIVFGLLPLVSLAVALATVLALTAGARALSMGQSFAAEQLATILTLGIGAALSLLVYVIAIALVWRRMAAWRLAGRHGQAAGALWALAITALIVALPLVLALVIPQHPAP